MRTINYYSTIANRLGIKGNRDNANKSVVDERAPYTGCWVKEWTVLQEIKKI